MLRALTSFRLLTVYDSITVRSGQALYSQDCPHRNLNEGETKARTCKRNSPTVRGGLRSKAQLVWYGFIELSTKKADRGFGPSMSTSNEEIPPHFQHKTTRRPNLYELRPQSR
ncbi:hypothetical protein TWF106_008458 [Orbilia oligospora]|uniref:Uncharacterized protein n=1 Tax=Orbilia oligospora TaxID=2813651 RepID=A0A6G1LUY8_ORBOL|nr:hypothetical protein TWF788_002596 [Orbilia oligospora]KAF3215115.1 hypothetical protein TWF191_009408 [Orbilia oligospora]KAF3222528.1 hypothetical protein TWF679_005999 [Orbilia oligospora]KAF3228056.1 hypothetical protein TWF106_008458 [Orbilia oligospora]KAF3234323.1 hypothetical protein TWF192_001557 [Orbilia oligospora]